MKAPFCPELDLDTIEKEISLQTMVIFEPPSRAIINIFGVLNIISVAMVAPGTSIVLLTSS